MRPLLCAFLLAGVTTCAFSQTNAELKRLRDELSKQLAGKPAIVATDTADKQQEKKDAFDLATLDKFDEAIQTWEKNIKALEADLSTVTNQTSKEALQDVIGIRRQELIEFKKARLHAARGNPVQLKQVGGATLAEVKQADISSFVDPNARTTPWTRSVVGVDVSASGSGRRKSQLFAEFFATAPIGRYGLQCDKNNISQEDGGQCTQDQQMRDAEPVEAKWWWWMNPRITSLPTKSEIPIAKLTPAGAFLSDLSGGNLSTIGQSLELLGGVEYQFNNPRKWWGFSGGDGSIARMSFSWIASFGASTPFDTENQVPPVFELNTTLRSRFANTPAAATHIAFLPRERSRFNWQYYTGFRIKTHFFKPEADLTKPEKLAKFPGIFDITFGQNEAITGGGLNGGVLRFDGFYPVEFIRGMHIFGTIMLSTRRPPTLDSIVLGSPVEMKFTDPGVHIEHITPYPHKDYFRLGIGVDLLKLLGGDKEKKELEEKVKTLEAEAKARQTN